MKKLLCLFSASLLVLTSCSKDDSSSNYTIVVLPNKIVFTGSDGVKNTSTVTYDGNKIVQVLGGGYKSVYSYTGDLITNLKKYYGDNLESETVYTYNNNKLVEIIENNIGELTKCKTSYTHNANGTILKETFSIDKISNVETKNVGSYKLEFTYGNMTQNSYMVGSDVLSTTTFFYDDANSPFKNILGFSKLLDDSSASNNQIKKATASLNGSYITTSSYKYNDKRYPTEETKTYSYEGGTSSVEYFYAEIKMPF